MSDQPPNNDDTETQTKPKPLKILRNIAAAAFGVRSRKDLNESGDAGKFRHYVIGAICFVGLFLLIVNGVVSLVLSQSS